MPNETYKTEFENNVGAILVPQPAPRKWRCTRGHTWESQYEMHLVFFGQIPDLAIDSEKFCMRCGYEWLREYCGKVREVK